MNDKIKLDATELTDEAWDRRTEADIKRQWNQMLSSDADLEMNEMIHSEDKTTTAYSDLVSARSKGLRILEF